MRPNLILMACLISLSPMGASATPGDSDLREARELLALSQSSIQDYDLLASKNAADSALQSQFVNYVTFAEAALPALRRASERGNAAGQYLLALTLRVPRVTETVDQGQVCDLLIRSAKQSFLPAVLVGPTICNEQLSQLNIREALTQAVGNASRDAEYYPLPSPAYRLCSTNRAVALAIPELSQEEFEAEAYFNIARLTKEVDRAAQDRKLAYLQDAVNRGCGAAGSAVKALESRLL